MNNGFLKITSYFISFLAFLTLFFHVYSITTFELPTPPLPPAPVAISHEDTSIPVSNSHNGTTSILFLGDVMLGRNVEYLSEIHGQSYVTEYIHNQLPSSDAVVANFESAMAIPHIRTRAYTTQFTTSKIMLDVLTRLGVTHVSLANNHTLDFGTLGYQTAVTELGAKNIMPFGHGAEVGSSSVVIIGDSPKIGILALNTIFIPLDTQEIRKQISWLEKSTDIQIAFVHWGDEYNVVHNDTQETIARFLIGAGIDTVVGHHPHVTQDIGLIDGVPVFYSLGNFIFDQYFSREVQEGYTLYLTATTEGVLKFSIIPVTSVASRSQPRLMRDDEINKFLQELALRSDPLLGEEILTNTIYYTATLHTNENEV